MNNIKILIFTNHFLPGYRAGGPVTSIANLSKLLGNDFDITIVTSNKDLGVDTPYENIEYDLPIKYEGFNIMYLSNINLKTIHYVIQENKPDLIYLNSFFSVFTQLVLFASMKTKFNVPILLAPRGELQKNALDIKKYKKKVYLAFYKLLKFYNKVYFHATDTIEYNRIKEMFLVKNIAILPNVPRVSRGIPHFKKQNELKLIFMSRIRDNKNLLLALSVLSRCKGNINLDIYGPIEDEVYWKQCQSSIEKLPGNIKVEYKGVVLPTEVPSVMEKYHALLLPTKTENFGHVIVEAMQSGVIPVISDQTPWVGLEKHGTGWDLSLKDEYGFTKVIEKLYEMNEAEYTMLSKNTIDYINVKLNLNQLKQQYIDLFNNALKFNKRGKNNNV